jgi:hypothetical protein
MSHWVGAQMSDHLSSLKPRKQKAKDWQAKAKKRRRASNASRAANRR